MTYYKLKEVLVLDGARHDEAKEKEFSDYYFARFEEIAGTVYWYFIMPLFEMRHGHLTRLLEATQRRMDGVLVISEDCVTITAAHHRYRFVPAADPLEQLLKE